MTRQKTKFVCANCGYESAQWLGRCPLCEQFNTMVEELVAPLESRPKKRSMRAVVDESQPIPSTELKGTVVPRVVSGSAEWDRVLGGGMVPGSTIIVAGEPGVGKSTLLTQVAAQMAQKGHKALYVSGEESPHQLAMRLERLSLIHSDLLVLGERNVLAISNCLQSVYPQIAVIDSIQSVFHPLLTSSPGSVGQVRESAAHLIRIAKESRMGLLFIGHVTKEGYLAGPKVLEHMVDAVLYLEGEATAPVRLLRATKNRFGTTGEVGLFQMTERGLEDLTHPDQWLLSASQEPKIGSAVALIVEGRRPLVAEVQALVASNTWSGCRRVATGVDIGRLLMLIAVLEKHLGCSLSNKDVYVNVVGGLRIRETAIDLPIALAILSSRSDRPLPAGTAFFGEVGLSGEVRPVSQGALRVREGRRLGFRHCIGPTDGTSTVDWTTVADVRQAAEMFHLIGANRTTRRRD
ncbi:MAG: DNA repair protein RadA [Armatimonadetes bacterium]|nr:DNA repair protein RadA [Armatimonadota bacterium]MDW8121658.1 DNA repair protein RadA [Armatimonadota bacterium]